MRFEEFYKHVMRMNAAKLYDRAQRLIEAKRDFYYLARGDSYCMRVRHERANQIVNPLSLAKDFLAEGKGLDYTVQQHALIDSEPCRFALDAIFQGVREFRIPYSALLN